MQVILPCLSDPFDYVLPGAQDQSGVSLLPFAPLVLSSLIEGDQVPVNQIPVASIPPPSFIWLGDWFGALPKTIANFPVEGGVMMNITIGNISTPIQIDPIQQFLNKSINQDSNGMYLDLGDNICGQQEVPPSYIIQGNSGLSDFGNISPLPSFPDAILMFSGSMKNIFVNLSTGFMQEMITNVYTESNQIFIVRGLTRDNNGSPLGNCQIFVLDVSRMVVNPAINSNPVIATGMSDNNGNYSLQVSGNVNYQIIGYLPGSPDVGGITIDSILPITG